MTKRRSLNKLVTKLSNKLSKSPRLTAAMVIVVVALIGTYLLISSHAAGPYASLEAESGTISGNATTNSDTNASNGSYVQFGTEGTQGGGCKASQAESLSSSVNPEQTALIDSGCYGLKLNEYASTQPVTLSSSGATDFKVSNSSLDTKVGGGPSGYYEVWQGCSWGACTNNNGAPFPLLVSSIGANQVTTSANCNTSQVSPSNSTYDNAYDIWFNANKEASSTSANGGNQGGTHLEMMVWLNQPVGGADPAGSIVESGVTIDGNTFNVYYNPTNPGPVASYVLTSTSSTISFDMLPMIENAESKGWLQPTWYLLDLEFGFEIWTGGSNLNCSSFTVNASS